MEFVQNDTEVARQLNMKTFAVRSLGKQFHTTGLISVWFSQGLIRPTKISDDRDLRICVRWNRTAMSSHRRASFAAVIAKLISMSIVRIKFHE